MGTKRIARLVERDGAHCWLCGRVVDLSLPLSDPMHATADHVVPRSKGGRYKIDNLRLAHARCNHKRGNRHVPEPSPKRLEPRAKVESPLPFLWEGKKAR